MGCSVGRHAQTAANVAKVGRQGAAEGAEIARELGADAFDAAAKARLVQEATWLGMKANEFSSGAAWMTTKVVQDISQLVTGDSSDSDVEMDEEALYLVFRDLEGQDHRLAFYRQGAGDTLGMIMAEWNHDETKVAGFMASKHGVVSQAEKLGVQVGWTLRKVGSTDVSYFTPQDAITVLRHEVQRLREHRTVRNWTEVVAEEHRREVQRSLRVIDDANVKVVLTANLHGFVCEDPRICEEHDMLGVVAFHYPGGKSRVDSISQATFLSNSFDLGVDGIALSSVEDGSRQWFSNVEAAFLAMEVWESADQLRFTAAEDARRAVQLVKHEGFDCSDDEPMDYIGYGSRAHALLAVLRSKFAAGTRLGDALVNTRGSFLLYFAEEEDGLHHGHAMGPPKGARSISNASTMSSRPSRLRAEGPKISESSLDEPGLLNTLGLLLMKVRGEISSADDGWSDWLERQCCLTDMLNGISNSEVRLAKLRWNAVVEHCRIAVREKLASLERNESEKRQRHTKGAKVSETTTQLQLAIQSEDSCRTTRTSTPMYKSAADAGISVFRPVWAMGTEVSQKALPPPSQVKERAEVHGSMQPGHQAYSLHRVQDKDVAGHATRLLLVNPADRTTSKPDEFLGPALMGAMDFFRQTKTGLIKL
mmetsp:Transcript_35238/g.64401  ORF Transcript_35238/g.64401 Transcript_35238/m.64401 type:complete len:649 (+) Transcript_35238:173-2119(+)